MNAAYGKASIDIDLITINQEHRHVITACVFMDYILFFSVENDFRLHFYYLGANSQLPQIKPLFFTSNIIYLHAYNESLFILTYRYFLIYQPFKNKTIHLFSSQQQRYDYALQILLKFVHYVYAETQFIVALSTSLDANYLIFYFITQYDQINTLTPYQISDFVIIDIEVEAVQLTANLFLEQFNLVIARSKQTSLSYAGRVVGQTGTNVTTKIDLNSLNEQCGTVARSGDQYICLSAYNSATQTIATFYRFGLWNRVDFVNEKFCRLECSSPIGYFQIEDQFVIIMTYCNDFFLLDKNNFQDEFAEFKVQQGRKIKKIETISREIRRLSGRLLWAGMVHDVFTIVVSDV